MFFLDPSEAFRDATAFSGQKQQVSRGEESKTATIIYKLLAPVPNAPGPLPPPPSPNQGRWRAGRDELAEAMSARAFPSASYTPLGTSGP